MKSHIVYTDLFVYIPKSKIPEDSMDNTGKIILKSILQNFIQIPNNDNPINSQTATRNLQCAAAKFEVFTCSFFYMHTCIISVALAWVSLRIRLFTNAYIHALSTPSRAPTRTQCCLLIVTDKQHVARDKDFVFLRFQWDGDAGRQVCAKFFC